MTKIIMETNDTRNKFNTGEMLTAYCIKNRIYKAALARKMNLAYRNIFYFLKTDTMSIEKLVEFSHVLKHNFVMDIAVQLPAEYKTNAPTDTTKDELIAQLEKELALLKAKNEALMEVMKGK
ncbi:MAG TPA: hypothetical protein PK431_02700 [Chitinophagales bacterium]|nr:hypothetical protein [Chitinophagales bacterium]